MTAARPSLPRALLAGAGVALTWAFARTEFHVVPTQLGLWRGLVDAPNPTRVGLALAGGVVAALLLRHRPMRASHAATWLCLAAAPLVPLLSEHALGLLAFQGPVLTLLVAGVVAVVAWSCVTPRVGPAPTAHPRSSPLSDLALLALAFTFYAWLGQRLPGPAGPQGDEPHYLLMTDSLLADGDLDLANQYAARTYRSFFAGTLTLHTSPATPRGTMYQVHTPGLPLLLAPAFALGGYAAAKLMIALMAALTSMLVQRLVREISGARGLALATWAAVTFIPPLPLYAVAIYPETAAALATALFLLSARDARPARLAAATLAAAGLPWVHPKFLPLAVVGLGLSVLRPGPRRWRILAVGVALGSCCGLLLFMHSLYGSASLAAAYGPSLSDDLALARLPWGFLALLFDRQFGLLWTAPLWLMALPGFVTLAQQRLGDALRATLLAGASVGVGACFSMWWGGACPPGRFVVPAIPALAVGLAGSLRRRPRLGAALLGVGVAVILLATDTPSALHNRADGESGLLRFLAPALDLDGRLPSFVLGGGGTLLLALTLAAALALAWNRGWRGALIGGIAYAVVTTSVQPGPLLDTRSAVARLLDAWDETRLRPLSGPLELGALSFPLELPAAPWRLRVGDVQRSRRVPLPPGLYRLDIQARPEPEPASIHLARLEVQSGAISLDWVFLRSDRALPTMTLPLVTGAPRFVLVASGVADASVVESARLVPLALVPRRLRETYHWPAVPEQDRYRVGSDALRVTVLDRSEPEGGGFRLDGEWGAFLVETAPGEEVEVRVERSHAHATDEILWGNHHVPLAAEGEAPHVLRNAGDLQLGPNAVLPVWVRAQAARVEFRTVAPAE